VSDARREKRQVRSTFAVPHMDCPSEVSLIRLALDGAEGIRLDKVDLGRRQIEVVHTTDTEAVCRRLDPLELGARLLDQQALATQAPLETPTRAEPGHFRDERKVLRQVLAINLAMFVLELGIGWVAQSTGLIADSLDMLADATVYLISLLAVRRGVALQRRAARAAGFLQLGLGLGVLAEVARRALLGSEPASLPMMAVSALALLANLLCVKLLMPHRRAGAHMVASWIFTTADALANLGVILAGSLVWLTGSAIPDLVVGTAIAVLVLRSAARILRLEPVS